MAKYATESKVWGATVGGTAGYTVSQLLLWVLGITVFGANFDADSSKAAVLAVPEALANMVGLVVTVGGVYVGGWFAKHTPRIEDAVLAYQFENGPVDDAPKPPPADDVEDEQEDADLPASEGDAPEAESNDVAKV